MDSAEDLSFCIRARRIKGFEKVFSTTWSSCDRMFSLQLLCASKLFYLSTRRSVIRCRALALVAPAELMMTVMPNIAKRLTFTSAHGSTLN